MFFFFFFGFWVLCVFVFFDVGFENGMSFFVVVVGRLEQESGFLFNMKYFEEKALAGEWDEVEKYLSGFTKVDDNRYSMKIFFEIRKQKYLEALDRYFNLLFFFWYVCMFICLLYYVVLCIFLGFFVCLFVLTIKL